MPDRILVVEDDLLLVAALQNILRNEDIEMDAAEHPDRALEKFNQVSYDLVVLDIGLPGRSGLDLLEDIRANDPEMPVVVITGNPTLQHARRAIRLGARDLVQKPLYGPDFLKSLKALLHDVHDRRARLRARELAVANRVAVSLCNHFNNLLGGIIGRASLITSQEELPAAVIEEFDHIQEQARRMADLVRRMSLFCQTHVDVDEGVPALEVLEDTVETSGRRFKRTIHLHQMASGVQVDCNGHRLATLLHEVITFCCELLPPENELNVTTTLDADGMAPVLNIRFLLSGCTVPDISQEQMLTPLAAGWDSLQSNLNGMAIAQVIALQMEGSIASEKIDETRTAVDLSFPVRLIRTKPPSAHVQEGFPVHGSILIVDDNPTVLRLTCDMVERLTGLQTHGTSDGAEAIALVNDAPKETVGLVLLDIILGEESGFDVYQQLRQLDPDLPVIFISGYAGDARLGEILHDDSRTAFLSKPFDMTQLKETLAGKKEEEKQATEGCIR